MSNARNRPHREGFKLEKAILACFGKDSSNQRSEDSIVTQRVMSQHWQQLL
jgi:hypothetical protein